MSLFSPDISNLTMSPDMASNSGSWVPNGPIFNKTAFYIPNIIFVALSLIFVLLRMWSRRLQRLNLDGSDYCVLLALIFSIVVTVAAYIGVQNGAGEHAPYLVSIDPTQGKIIMLLKVLMLATIPYLMSLAFSRISILLLYRKIFPTPFMRAATVVVGTFVSMATVCTILTTVFSCQPVDGFWLAHVMNPKPKCISLFALYMFVGLSTIIADAACLFLPIWDILKLRLERRDKTILIGMFLIGGFTIVVSIPRTVIISEGDDNDISYWLASVALWSTIETSVAIICVCLPVLRPVIRQVKTWLGINTELVDRTADRYSGSQRLNSNEASRLALRMPKDGTLSAKTQVVHATGPLSSKPPPGRGQAPGSAPRVTDIARGIPEPYRPRRHATQPKSRPEGDRPQVARLPRQVRALGSSDSLGVPAAESRE